ncbi:MAG: cystathionine beta-lyase [Burkholderiaceae bacterium]
MEHKTATRLIHHDYEPPKNFGGLNVGVHHASTITFPNVAAMRARDWKNDAGYTYGLHGTPTTFTLARRIAALEGGKHCVLVPSGLAAIALVDLALLKSGDRLLLPDNVYNPSRELATTLLADLGVGTRFYDPMDVGSLEAAIDERTKLIWIETPGSVTMEVPDVPAIVAFAKRHGILTAIDNTWAAGLLFRPFDRGVDIVMHALTKYPSGGSDVLMGSVTTIDEQLHQRIKTAHMRLGFGIGGDDCYLMLRSLATMALRLSRSGETALALAQGLAARPEVGIMLHPAVPACPGHAFWKRDFEGAAGLFSIVLISDVSEEKADAMIDALELFRIGYSWGGSHSLAVPYRVGVAGGPARAVADWPRKGVLVRLYAGMEDASDLIADLEQAFTRLR